uniref:myb/SANT-like DNA-binding domain-containing protein 3 isoform X3 n=1 Tax=Styela clava TaxID=7725 RepID=UPI00193A91F1|nr:myb/SANT-like DNA-binding domain-containing protein 3 isoform X3 [Styela clava]
MARSANFVNSEKQLLVQIISEHPQVESKRTDKVSVVQKNLAWKQIEAKFNATGTLCRRTEKNLKDAWKNIKNKAKQDNAQRKRHLRQTGGGPGVPTDELSEKVEALIPRQINCLANNFDDDNQIESSLEEQTYTLVSVAEESSSFSDGNESAVLQTLSTGNLVIIAIQIQNIFPQQAIAVCSDLVYSLFTCLGGSRLCNVCFKITP